MHPDMTQTTLELKHQEASDNLERLASSAKRDLERLALQALQLESEIARLSKLVYFGDELTQPGRTAATHGRRATARLKKIIALLADELESFTGADAL